MAEHAVLAEARRPVRRRCHIETLMIWGDWRRRSGYDSILVLVVVVPYTGTVGQLIRHEGGCARACVSLIAPRLAWKTGAVFPSLDDLLKSYKLQSKQSGLGCVFVLGLNG
jgi:hypothetical protein